MFNQLALNHSRIGVLQVGFRFTRGFYVGAFANMSSTHNHEKTCIFCKIIRDEAPAEKIYQDDDVICIKDVKPASTHHYLIIPKIHVRNPKFFKAEDEEIFDKVVSAMNTVCQQQNIDVNTARTGFHWAPFNTVDHLHLHVISPVENIGFLHNMMFRPNSFWFVSIDYVKSTFKNMSSKE